MIRIGRVYILNLSLCGDHVLDKHQLLVSISIHGMCYRNNLTILGSGMCYNLASCDTIMLFSHSTVQPYVYPETSKAAMIA